MDILKHVCSSKQLTTVVPLQEQAHTKWRWNSDAVMMDTSPDFLESLSEPSTGMGDTSPDFLESLSEPSAGIRLCLYLTFLGKLHSRQLPDILVVSEVKY